MQTLCSKPCKVKAYFIVRNDRGIHTRPSTEIVKCASSFRSEMHLSCMGMRVNAKSILGILMLSAEKGRRIKVEAEGEDAEEAVQAMIVLARNSFNMHY